MNNFSNDVKNNLEQAYGWFRHLHQNPELSFQEHETTKFIIDKLKKLENIEILTPTETGCIGVLKGKLDGPVIGLRADIDALPIFEETDIDYKSLNNGVMHACGHDAHTSVLLTVATVLNGYADQLQGTVKFIFQPAEELPPGGAIDLVKSGALDDVQYFFGAHLMPNMPTGTVALKPGLMFYSSDKFEITIQGKGGHAAIPNLAVDPVIIQAEMILAFQTIVSRKTNPIYSPTISTTVVKTAEGPANVIPDTVRLAGSVRNLNAEVRQETAEWIKKVANGVCDLHGATCKVRYTFGYDTVINDDIPYGMSLKAAQNILNEKAIIVMKDPIPASEDFGSYRKIAPSTYFLYGGANEEKQTNITPHHPKYKADEESFYYGAMMFLSIVEETLMKK
ncbi:MAG: amidohydrolase [Turicibacter sp.]|nr:amidohydrolase [Turicibacter sp.]